MKYKRILAGTILALTLPLTVTSAHAHPGRTDGNGGHTDSETGWYHYHHGYEAHAHYDMDGDGDIDCPYDFDDQTGQNSGTSSGSSGSSSSSTYRPEVSGSVAAPEVFPPQLPTIEVLPATDFSEINQIIGARSSNGSSGSDSSSFYSPLLAYIASSLVCIPLTFLVMWHHRSGNKTGAICSIFITAFFALYSFMASWLIIWGTYSLARRYFAWSDKRKVRKAEEKRKKAILQEAYRKLANPPRKVAEPVVSNVQPAPKPAMPPEPPIFVPPDPEINFRPTPGPNSEVSVHARCRDTCYFLWHEALTVRNSISPPLSSDATIYVWTALFYTVVKTLRSQGAVNRIYAYFEEAAGKFVVEEKYRSLVVKKVREIYRSIRPLLNGSNIDPRTANGRRDLWFLIARYIPQNADPSLQMEFEAAAGRIWQTIADVFPQSQPYPKTGDVHYSIGELPES